MTSSQISNHASPHASSWHKQGAIPGGTVLALAAVGQICLAGTLAGLHLSEDGGLGWTQIRYGDAVQALAMAANGAAFAGCASGRLLISADGGRGWRELDRWQFGTATAIALAPDFAKLPHVFVATAEGIFRSMDGGETWQEANFGLLDTEALCLAIAPDYADSELLWAGTANGGLYRSRNAGRAWRESGEGLAAGAISALAVSPHFAQDRTLFAGLSDDAGGVFISTDVGESWQHAGCDEEINSLAIAFDGKRMLVAAATGVLTCDIATLTWERSADIQAVALIWVLTVRLLAGTWTEGVAIFNTGSTSAESWDRDTTLSARVLPVVTAGPHDLLALDSLGHILASQDHGDSWAEVGLIEGAQGFAEVVSSSPTVVTARALHVWTGEQWRTMALPMLIEGDEARAVHESTQHAWVLGTQNGQVYVSTDEAATWQHLPALAEGVAVLAVHASRRGALYALVLITAGDHESTAEVWMLSAMTATAWQMLMALDGLSAPLATMQVCEGSLADLIILAAQNNLVSLEAGVDGEPQPFVLDPSAVVTALRASPNFAGDQMVFAATNEGVFQLRREPAGWALAAHALEDRPVVSLFEDEGVVGAAVLGGELWRYEARSM